MRSRAGLVFFVAVCTTLATFASGCVDQAATEDRRAADGAGDVGGDGWDVVLPDAVVGSDVAVDSHSELDIITRPDAADTLTGDVVDPGDTTDTAEPDTIEPDTIDPPTAVEPCATGACWSTLSFSGACGLSTLNEDFSSGLYNVHNFSLFVPGGVTVELTLAERSGAWDPALLLHDDQGATVFDGERGVASAELTVELLASGRGAATASLRILSSTDRQMSVFVTGWHVVDGGFTPTMPTNISYAFTVLTDCPPPEGLLSPPNFDDTNVVGGYFLMPQADPPGLYTRRADDCSRGNKLLIDVLYTVAVRWNAMHPEYTPMEVWDMNKGPCSTVNHATHDDGTHADVHVTCATEVACANIQPAVDLATLFIDTGQMCGIIFNDTEVQNVINPYFASQYAYTPWWSQFMRTVGSHIVHFHVRVKKPDGSCSPY